MTLPQEALAALASDKEAPAPAPTASGELIGPPDEIFDRAACEAEISQALVAATDAKEIRASVVAVLQQARAAGLAYIRDRLTEDPFNVRPALRSYSYLTDCCITAVLNVAIQRLHPNPTPTAGEKIAVIAVGGYGRAEMAPASDVDLLFLAPHKVSGWIESVVESTLYMLWDLRLKVGHSTRSVKECLRLGREDYTIRTALLEHRHLYGDATLTQTLGQRLRKELFRTTAADFIEAKLAERDSRHRKQGGQRYMVEPNVKEGKGGLRDLQTVFWIDKYVHGVNDLRELVAKGIFRKEEYDGLERAESFLHAVRCQLHLIAERAMDQLTFDMQVEIASRMGYRDKAGRRAVEHFMQDYFRHATRVGELTRIYLTALEASHIKKEPMLVGLFRRRKQIGDGYEVRQNRLAIRDDDVFLTDPLNLLKIFEEALRTGYLIHPDAMRLVAANLWRIDGDLRANPQAVKSFLNILLRHGNPERGLRRMNELGVLAAFLPEFEPIVAMMQFNMYHHYTVDEHTIQCISVLAQIERGELVEELPIASRILSEGVNRKVLYLALLLHDIGKGRPEDHSVLGAQIARKVAPRLGLKPSECDTVEWLVRYHLLMSDMAQKRDLSEPRTVRDFAKAVENRRRLDLLTVLTVCDIRGVGPGTWNNWKAQLIRQLYRETATALETGLEDVNRKGREAEAKKALRDTLSDWDKKDLRAETARHYGPYWQGLPTSAHATFAGLLRDIDDVEVRIDLTQDTDRDATRAAFAMADHPGIFARLAGALALVSANVVDARSYTTKDGYVVATFWIQDADGRPFEEARLPRLRKMIERTLAGEVIAREALADRDKLKKRERDFRVPTSISFDNDGSERYTIIEVDTRDRPGLLYDLARTLAASNVYVASAVIATYGEQAVDTFYVKDAFGLKFYSESKQKGLERKLREAIAAGAERARAK